jgi:hypothetical protein
MLLLLKQEKASNFFIFFQLGKYFGTQLHAKDDALREEAVAAMAALSKQVQPIIQNFSALKTISNFPNHVFVLETN